MTLRLHYNENTAGCSPAVLRALGGLTAQKIAEYQDDRNTAAAMAEWFGVSVDAVLPVNGLDEGLLLAAQRAALDARAGYEAIVIEPAFEMYAAAVSATGGDAVRVMPSLDFAFDVDRVLAAATPRTRLVFICDPNNPTGAGVARTDIETIAAALPGALIFVDEAYADFSGRTLVGNALVDRPNVVVGRTFSKAHGLAGLRIGALVAAPETIARLAAIALPYRVNVAASVALVAALGDRDHYNRTVAEAAASRALVAEACARLGLTTWPSEANFSLVRIGARAAECAAWFARRGIRVRDRSTLAGCEGCLRITTGPVAHTARAIWLLEEWHATASR